MVRNRVIRRTETLSDEIDLKQARSGSQTNDTSMCVIWIMSKEPCVYILVSEGRVA